MRGRGITRQALMGFKEDADFARFVSMGAVGAAAVARHLGTQHGHRMIELERYAMANKVWQTKVKRLRLPDLLCVRCGQRVEARAKSKLGMVLSHSDKPGRQWDAGGMRDDDLYAFLRADLGTFPPETGLPTFFTTAALRSTVEHARRAAPKAASEGSEVTLTWPCWVPSRHGRFVRIDDRDRIVHRDIGGRERSYWQWRRWPGRRIVYMESDEPFEGGETIVAGIVPTPGSLDCTGDTWDLAAAIGDEDETGRYAAIRASGACGRLDMHDELVALRADRSVDWRLRLEAAASLARLHGHRWTDALAEFVNDDTGAGEQGMEAVLALSELPSSRAAEALMQVAADTNQTSELRSAAAWGIGQGGSPQTRMLLELVLDVETMVALHAIAAIDELTDDMEAVLIEWIMGADDRRADVGAHLLARHRRIDSLLDACENGGRSRVRALAALGGLPRETVRLAAGSRLTHELTSILEPMWHSRESWLKTTGQEGLEALEVQKVRFDPVSPGHPWRTAINQPRP